VHPKPVSIPETEVESGLGNIETAIASALRPSAMVVIPVLRTALLPSTVFLPSALLYPAPLLLPSGRLLPRTLRLLLPGLLGSLFPLWLRLPGLLLPRPLLHLRLLAPLLLLRLPGLLLLWPLLHLRLLAPLLLLRLPGLLLLRPLLRLGFLPALLWLRLLCPLLRPLGRLRVLLFLRPCLIPRRLLPLRLRLCAWRRALGLLALLAFGFRLFLILVLRVRYDAGPEKQEKGRGAGSSNEMHDNRLL